LKSYSKANCTVVEDSFILSPSFLSSHAWTPKYVTDILVLGYKLGNPLFFITIMINPNWFEIVLHLKPRHYIADISYIVYCVFPSRLKYTINQPKCYIRKFYIYIIKVIKFQKYGLLYCHIILQVILYKFKNIIVEN
jgi:hypothetical protein